MFLLCTQKLLEEFCGKKPMSYEKITEKALAEGWLVTRGKTPQATMYDQVIIEIKKRGICLGFVLHGRGCVGLSQWIEHGPVFQIEQHNPQITKVQRDWLPAMK